MTHTRDTEHYDPPPPAERGSQVNVTDSGPREVVPPSPSPMVMVRRVLGLLFGILIVLIGLRILLLMLGANEGNALVDGIYGITEIFVAPFRGVFAIDQVSPTGRSVFDIAALVAIIGWSLIALLILAILNLADRRTY
jgi:nitric oxide reductase large subunit